MIYYQIEKNNYKHQIKYIFDLFSSILRINFTQINDISSLTEKDILINYSEKKIETECKTINIVPSNFFGNNYLKPESLPELPLERYDDLPIIYRGKDKIGVYVKRSKGSIETNIDIIASSFFMVTRYEEVILHKEIVPNRKDKYERFPATASLAYQENFLDRPIVNEYIELFWSWIDSFGLGLKRKKPWGDKDFAVCLTHDIDEIRRYKFYPPLGTIKRSLLKKNLKRALLIFIDYLKTKIGLKQDLYLESTDYIVNLEKKYGFRSSFYFMANNKRYLLADPWLNFFFKKLKENKFEIGLHPTFAAYNNFTALKTAKEKLEKIAGTTISGMRQHHLKCEIPLSWRIWEKVGFKHDSTLSFDDCIGFRCGICHPFHPFDLEKNRVVNLWEIPPVIMDCTLEHWEKLSPEKGQKKLNKFLKVIQKYNGLFVMILHPSYMCHFFEPEWKKCFEDFYKLISKEKCLVKTVNKTVGIWESAHTN